MRINALIKRLQKMQRKHGNVKIDFYDPNWGGGDGTTLPITTIGFNKYDKTVEISYRS